MLAFRNAGWWESFRRDLNGTYRLVGATTMRDVKPFLNGTATYHLAVSAEHLEKAFELVKQVDKRVTDLSRQSKKADIVSKETQSLLNDACNATKSSVNLVGILILELDNLAKIYGIDARQKAPIIRP